MEGRGREKIWLVSDNLGWWRRRREGDIQADKIGILQFENYLFLFKIIQHLLTSLIVTFSNVLASFFSKRICVNETVSLKSRL